MTKFYTYNQNNSGGSFDIDDDVAHYVIVEAIDAAHANARASKWLYFDGCSTGKDCSCCGDRWYPASDHGGEAEPMIYDKKPSEISDRWAKVGEPYCHVYYMDGRKETFTQSKDPRSAR